MTKRWGKQSKRGQKINGKQEDVVIFQTCKVKHDNSQEQAGTGATHQLTIFLAFYFIVGEHMEEESEH